MTMTRDEFSELLCDIAVDGRDAEAASEWGEPHSETESTRLHEEAMAAFDTLTAELAQARAELAALRTGWIKCADRLPEKDPAFEFLSVDVSARDDKGNEYQRVYCSTKGVNVGSWFECFGANIIEWRPLA